MTQKEYNKYHQDVYDILGRHIDIGDIIAATNHYRASVLIGKVSHFVESGRVAVGCSYKCGKTTYRYFIYRFPEDIVIVKKTKKKK